MRIVNLFYINSNLQIILQPFNFRDFTSSTKYQVNLSVFKNLFFLILKYEQYH
jgi:hypothetical protein